MTPVQQSVTVFYDGSCPLCSAEVEIYARADSRGMLKFTDVSTADFKEDTRLGRELAMSRFHIRMSDGQQFSGAGAFLEVWRVIPSWARLTKIASVPGITRVLEFSYLGFLRFKPIIVLTYCRNVRLISLWRLWTKTNT